MEDASNAIRMVERLGAMGVNISIDDFGTGYSSLAYLRKLRAGELKIDRSFVLDLEASADARAVVDAIVKLAQALGLKVVAEGVETEAQHEILRALGCHELQGFLFARPMSAMALSAWAMDDDGPRASSSATRSTGRRSPARCTSAHEGSRPRSARLRRRRFLQSADEHSGLHPCRGPAADPEGADRRPRRRDGHDDPAPRLSEADYRGERFKDHPKSLKGNNDLLQLTRPDVDRGDPRAVPAAGADIVETNTFGATSVAQADYEPRRASPARSTSPARGWRARPATASASADKPRFVAGALGPTPKTASISPDVNDPAARNVTFAELRDAYREQAEGLLEGGCDLFLVETIFDTLNAKAAIFALDELMEESGERLPVIVSGTVTDASGRILSGQTVRRVLAQRAPRAAARGRPQLRPRRGADAALRRGAGADRRRHLRQLLSERRPAQPDERDRLRRDARDHRRPARGVRASRASSTSPAAAAARRPSTSR